LAQEIKNKYQDIEIILNGGIKTIEDIKSGLKTFPGVMIGREAYQNPWLLTEIEREIFGSTTIIPREAVAQTMIPYIEQQARLHGTPAKSIARHMLGLYNGLPGARAWRRVLSKTGDVREALESMSLQKAA
ncbi:MAG: tRNA-dihydrouridine synthase, partial [Proteobacteria bacterium]|nr:tRNA-dihydrouridine synthase [Pseudomonadota bacterium]